MCNFPSRHRFSLPMNQTAPWFQHSTLPLINIVSFVYLRDIFWTAYSFIKREWVECLHVIDYKGPQLLTFHPLRHKLYLLSHWMRVDLWLLWSMKSIVNDTLTIAGLTFKSAGTFCFGGLGPQPFRKKSPTTLKDHVDRTWLNGERQGLSWAQLSRCPFQGTMLVNKYVLDAPDWPRTLQIAKRPIRQAQPQFHKIMKYF